MCRQADKNVKSAIPYMRVSGTAMNLYGPGRQARQQFEKFFTVKSLILAQDER